MDACKPGKELGGVYRAAEEYIKQKKPELLQGLDKNVGTGMGLEFRESGTTLNTKNTKEITAGMVFNLVIGVKDLERLNETDEKKKKYAIILADTIVVTPDGEPEMLTAESGSRWTDVSYEFGGDDEPEEKKPKKEKSSDFQFETRNRSTKVDFQHDDEARKQHQQELEQKLKEDAERRFA